MLACIECLKSKKKITFKRYIKKAVTELEKINTDIDDVGVLTLSFSDNHDSIIYNHIVIVTYNTTWNLFELTAASEPPSISDNCTKLMVVKVQFKPNEFKRIKKELRYKNYIAPELIDSINNELQRLQRELRSKLKRE